MKGKLIDECVKILSDPALQKWLDERMAGRHQDETIIDLLKGLKDKEITEEQALAFAFIVGYQWDVKFKGVP